MVLERAGRCRQPSCDHEGRPRATSRPTRVFARRAVGGCLRNKVSQTGNTDPIRTRGADGLSRDGALAWLRPPFLRGPPGRNTAARKHREGERSYQYSRVSGGGAGGAFGAGALECTACPIGLTRHRPGASMTIEQIQQLRLLMCAAAAARSPYLTTAQHTDHSCSSFPEKRPAPDVRPECSRGRCKSRSSRASRRRHLPREECV